MAAAIALGATSMSDIAVLAHLAPVLGDAPSGPTVRRALDLAGTAAMLDRIARARARARAHVWQLIEETPAGFPWLVIAGKTLTGWLVIDMDATLVTASSDKEGAAPTWKKGYGFHPLGAWLANTRECLAMLLRPGNAGSNTFTDHKEVLAAAIRQVPARFRRKILIRVDGAGASHELVKHLLSLSSARRAVLFTCGWMITAADEDAIRQVPAGAWKPGTGPGRRRRGGQGRRGDHGPDEPRRELAGRPALDRPPGEAVPPPPEEPDGLREEDRLEVLHHLHEHPGHRDRRRPGSHHPQYIDVVHREHAVVETGGVRTAKAMGLRNLPSKTWQVNCGWVIAANIAADLAAWTRLLGHRDDADLREADPDTLRYRIWHIPARLARHARAADPEDQPRTGHGRRRSSPAGSGSAPCPHPPDQHEQPQRQERRPAPARSEPVRTRAHRAPPRDRHRQPNRHHTRNRAPAQSVTGPQKR